MMYVTQIMSWNYASRVHIGVELLRSHGERMFACQMSVTPSYDVHTLYVLRMVLRHEFEAMSERVNRELVVTARWPALVRRIGVWLHQRCHPNSCLEFVNTSADEMHRAACRMQRALGWLYVDSPLDSSGLASSESSVIDVGDIKTSYSIRTVHTLPVNVWLHHIAPHMGVADLLELRLTGRWAHEIGCYLHNVLSVMRSLWRGGVVGDVFGIGAVFADMMPIESTRLVFTDYYLKLLFRCRVPKQQLTRRIYFFDPDSDDDLVSALSERLCQLPIRFIQCQLTNTSTSTTSGTVTMEMALRLVLPHVSLSLADNRQMALYHLSNAPEIRKRALEMNAQRLVATKRRLFRHADDLERRNKRI
jgi:hypothetical protein